jgi:putative tricarboxylic transport membrane protein
MSVTSQTAGRKTVSTAIAFSAAAFIALAGKQSLAASAPDYPAKPVTFFALSGPGSGFDTTTRAVANALVKEKLVKVPLPVENSGNSLQAMTLAATRYKGDPYMVSVNSVSGMFRYASGQVRYNHRDYTPLAALIGTYYAVAVRTDSPYKTIAELVKDLKERPEKTPICGGTGDDRVFYGGMFSSAGVDITKIVYVAYAGGGEINMAVMEGSCRAAVNSVDEQLALVEAKKIRFLAVSSPKRYASEVMKAVPTLQESGIGFEWANLRYAFAAPGFPDYAKAYWTDVLAKMVKTPTWKQTIAKYNWDDAFQVDGLNETLDKKQALVTEILTKLGMAKKQ